MILEVLLEAIRQQAQIANKAEKLVLKEKEKSESEVADLLQSARKAQQHLERLNALKIEEYEKYLDGKIGKDDYLKQRGMYNQEIEQTSSQISKLEADYELQKLKNKESENQFVEHFKKKQEIEELSRDLVNKLVDSIYVFGENQIEIVWNFADDYEKILEMIQ